MYRKDKTQNDRLYAATPFLQVGRVRAVEKGAASLGCRSADHFRVEWDNTVIDLLHDQIGTCLSGLLIGHAFYGCTVIKYSKGV